MSEPLALFKDRGRRPGRLGGLTAFALPVLLFFALSLRDGTLAQISPDGRCYLSVAENFLATGHFIQTYKPIEGFVVPFGLPLILTVLRALGLGVNAIVVIQHLLAGLGCLLLYRAEKNRFGSGGLAPAVFCLCLLRAGILPDNVYVECWYLPLLCLILWLLSREDMPLEKKLLWLNLAGFAAFVIRLVLLLVWLPILGYTLWAVGKRRFPLRRALALGALFAALLLGNAALNLRETGHWVWMENYSGSDLYIANNPLTGTEYFSSDKTWEYTGEEFAEIWNDWRIDQTQRNQLYKSLTRRWIAGNPGTFLKNTAVKCYHLFISYWRFGTLPALAGGLWCLREAEGERRRRWGAELLIALALAASTSCGLVLGRYTLPVWPLAALHLAALGHLALARLRPGEKERA